MAEVSGPIFEPGAWKEAVAAYGEWAEHEIAVFADAAWHSGMAATFQHPTGYYESTVHVDRNVVHDEGTIYNFWLEGIGSRNAPVTRFAGYHNARSASVAAQRQAVDLVSPIPREFLARMGSAA